MSAFIPHSTDINQWKKHFTEMAEGKIGYSQKIYTMGDKVQSGGGDEARIQMVVPTQQIVDCAKSELKRLNEEPQSNSSLKRRQTVPFNQSAVRQHRGKAKKRLPKINIKAKINKRGVKNTNQKTKRRKIKK